MSTGLSTPVARVPRGGIIETNTVDADGKALEARGLESSRLQPVEPAPSMIEGAEPG